MQKTKSALEEVDLRNQGQWSFSGNGVFAKRHRMWNLRGQRQMRDRRMGAIAVQNAERVWF